MPLQKQPIDLPFGVGIDTKTDPKQVQVGKLLALSNTVFQIGELLQKRNGYLRLPTINDSTVNTLTAFSGSLTAVGTSLYNYVPENTTWYNKGSIASVQLDVLPIVRSATSQSQQDAVVSSEGLICTVWKDSNTNSYYQIVDGNSGQIIASVALPSTATVARVFGLGRYFVITFLATVSAATHLQYIAIPLLTPTSPRAAVDLATDVAALTSGYDGYIANDTLYIAWSATGPNVKIRSMSQSLAQSSTKTIAGRTATKISVTADTSSSTPNIWLTYWDTTNNNLYGADFDSSLNVVRASTVITNNANIVQVASTASGGVLTAYYEVADTYSYSSAVTNLITKNTLTSGGVIGTPAVVLRGVALASKAFILNGIQYLMVVYGSGNAANQNFEPTYFLSDSSGNIIAKLAYSNSFGYPSNQVLPQANLSGNVIKIAYLFKDLIAPVNKTQGSATVAGVYSQTGINLATFTINDNPMVNVETASSLHFAGGFVWQYDGAKPVEHGFHLWPEDIEATWSATGGSVVAQPDGATNNNAYFYQVTYEWTDAAGLIHRSAPSIPISVTTTGSGSSGSITLDIPTLRLTYKTVNKVRIVIYRWSVEQQIYYQVTSVSNPLLNDPTVDSVEYVDTQADASILGNQIIYTTGGVVENIAAPACKDIGLYKTRAFLPDAEDENLLWYSKQTIENTPVEFSDLFTLFLAPTIGSQGSTGKVKCIAPMDDKNVFFKPNAIYYNTGNGPDNTGSNNDFSDPQFITATVGCDNPQSIVFQPQGLMFQSDKGIWLLGRDLSTTYIGAPVEAYNDATVLSANAIPGTNQVRFTLSTGITLMYDYYYGQWGTFRGVPAISATLYQGLHTYLNSLGQVFQENPSSSLDGSNPVLISFTTPWIKLAGLQGFERFYQLLLLGEYISPFKLNVQIAYDYNPAPLQSTIVTPMAPNAKYGSQAGPYGSGSPYGGGSKVFEARVFPQVQKCESFQITVTEIYDSQYGVPAGAGLTLSGLQVLCGIKKGSRTSTSARSFG